MSSTVFIGLGSNVGDREQHCRLAVEQLQMHPQIQIVRGSSLLETKALTLEGPSQPDYLNGVVEIATDLSPQELLQTLQAIEYRLGRRRDGQRWQPRIIDLDILLFGNIRLQTPELTIPHPEIRQRPFLIQLLKELGVSDETLY